MQWRYFSAVDETESRAMFAVELHSVNGESCNEWSGREENTTGIVLAYRRSLL